jgi:hypothetical protein
VTLLVRMIKFRLRHLLAMRPVDVLASVGIISFHCAVARKIMAALAFSVLPDLTQTYSDNTTNRFGVQCVPCASGKTSNLGSTSCSTCTRGTMNGTGVVNGTAEVIPCKANRIVSSKRSYVVFYFVLAGFSMIRRMS